MSTVVTPSYPVTLNEGDDANGIAGIIATLLEQNFENVPSRIDLARRLARPVTIYSSETDSACTVSFGSSEAVVFNDVVGKPSVTVTATVEQIFDLSQLKMKGSGLLPVGFFTMRGMRVLGAIATHKLVVKGLITHPITALRVIALVSVVS